MEKVESLPSLPEEKNVKSKSLWSHAWTQLVSNKYALISMSVVATYALLAIFTGTGLIASSWDQQFGDSYLAPSFEFLLGTDLFGRSVALKVLKGAEVAMSVGLMTAIISMIIGVSLGAISGFFGGKVDEAIVWFYTTFSSIP